MLTWERVIWSGIASDSLEQRYGGSAQYPRPDIGTVERASAFKLGQWVNYGDPPPFVSAFGVYTVSRGSVCLFWFEIHMLYRFATEGSVISPSQGYSSDLRKQNWSKRAPAACVASPGSSKAVRCSGPEGASIYNMEYLPQT